MIPANMSHSALVSEQIYVLGQTQGALAKRPSHLSQLAVVGVSNLFRYQYPVTQKNVVSGPEQL